MGREGTPRSGWRSALSIAFVGICLAVVGGQGGGAAAGTKPLHGAVQIAQSTGETATWKPTRAEIRAVQLRLQELSFDPGAIDGDFGPRSAAALRAYQSSLGLTADGRLTKALFAQLMGNGVPEAAPVPPDDGGATEPAVPDAAASSTECRGSVMGLWTFQDAQGSEFQLGLLEDGAVEGPFYSQQWSWQPMVGGVEIRYDNGMGVSVVRYGTLQQDGRLTGDAQDSRGNRWAWQANRVADSAGGSTAACPKK